MYKYYDDEN